MTAQKLAVSSNSHRRDHVDNNYFTLNLFYSWNDSLAVTPPPRAPPWKKGRSEINFETQGKIYQRDGENETVNNNKKYNEKITRIQNNDRL